MAKLAESEQFDSDDVGEADIGNNIDIAALIPHRPWFDAQTILACGRRQSGKSYLIREYMRMCEPRCLIVDPFDDFGGTIAPSIDVALAALRDSCNNGWSACRVRIQPPVAVDSRDWGEELFRKLCESRKPWEMLLSLDEIARYSNLHERNEFAKLILGGRHIGVRVIAGCQRMALVPLSIQSEMTDLCIFKQVRPADIRTITEWTGNTIAQRSRLLEKRQCIYVRF